MIYLSKFDLIKSIAKVEELGLRSAGHTRNNQKRKFP